MDFSVIFQLRTKKFWWMDVIFYFVISLLVATVFCWMIFLVKNNFQREDIKKETAALETVGTTQQKDYEKSVINYRNKIADFTTLFSNHQFASNVFAFMQTETLPNIWFKQFSLDEKNNAVQLSGESDNMDAFSRQVAVFEKNKYVANVGALSSSLGSSARVDFNINLALDQSIFNYIATLNEHPAVEPAPENTANGQDSEKLITSFHLLLDPEVIGTIDQANFAVNLDVLPETDVKNLITSIVISPTATVSPATGAVQDFTSPVDYTVTAKDGSTQNYKVTVNVLQKPVEKTSQSGFVALFITVLVLIIIIAIAVMIFFAWKKFKLKKEHAN